MTEQTPTTTTTPEPTVTQTTTAAPTTFTAEQEAELNRRIAAARKDGEKDAKAKFDREATERAEAERLERERTESEAKGEFGKVKESIEKERDGFKGRAEAAESQVAAYETALAPIIAAKHGELKALGEAALKGYDEKAPAADRLTWLNERRDFLVEMGVIGEDGAATPGNGPSPKPAGPKGMPTVEQTRRELAAARGQRLTR